MIIRPARGADADGINLVYNWYVTNSPATFEVEPVSKAWRERWIDEREGAGRLRAFVALDPEGRVAGFAGSAPFDQRRAYETSVKTSVFLAQGAEGKGLGGALYAALFEGLHSQDIHRAYALVVMPNPASERLHLRSGFQKIATLDEVGRKFGRYYDVAWFEKRL